MQESSGRPEDLCGVLPGCTFKCLQPFRCPVADLTLAACYSAPFCVT